MKEYATRQRALLITLFRQNGGEPLSAQDILARLPQGEKISRSAVYRNLNKMVQEGILQKSLSDNGREALYLFIDCSAHCDRLHLRCELCGRIFHMEDSTDEEAVRAALQKSGFQIDGQASVLAGVCKNCDRRDGGQT